MDLHVHRDNALATISADGILLVLASMIDNMPYVLAEASVMRIPLLIYDVGGVTEMIDPKQHADIICGTPKVRAAACSCLARAHPQTGSHQRTQCMQCWHDHRTAVQIHVPQMPADSPLCMPGLSWLASCWPCLQRLVLAGSRWQKCGEAHWKVSMQSVPPT